MDSASSAHSAIRTALSSCSVAAFRLHCRGCRASASSRPCSPRKTKASRDARKIVGAPTVSQRNSDRYRLRVTRRPYSLQRAHQVEQGLVTSQFLQNDRQQIPRPAQRSRPRRDLAHRQKPHLCAPASQFLLVAHGATASAPEKCRWVAHADCLIDLVGGARSNRQLAETNLNACAVRVGRRNRCDFAVL